MSISQDPDFFKILIGIIAGLLGVLNVYSMKILGDLKNSDRDIYSQINSVRDRISTLEGEHRERHRKWTS